MRVLVTGANGFIGRALVRHLVEGGFEVRGAVRSGAVCKNCGAENVVVGDIGPVTEWSPALDSVDFVVHLAARAHIIHDQALNSGDIFRKVNVDGTRRLAQQAFASGIKRFVYVSSAGVMGNHGYFTEESSPCPQSLYARSKLEAEQALKEVAQATGLEIVVVRPPLVYGPGNPGNFLRLLHWINQELPMPFASIDNRRSFIGIDNLVDFLALCLAHPRATNEVFLVADSEVISTPELIKRLACSMGVQARLLPFPVTLLRLGANLIGKGGAIARLTDSFVLNSDKAQHLLGWAAKTSLAQGLKQTAQWYKEAYDRRAYVNQSAL